jgi:hypothetical protein
MLKKQACSFTEKEIELQEQILKQHEELEGYRKFKEVNFFN